MAHLRQQIREKVQTTLQAISGYSSKVFASRVFPLARTTLPAICVYSKSEQVEAMGMGSGQARDLELVIEIYVKAAADLDDAIDSICVLVEEAMATDRTLNGLALDSNLISTEIDLQEGETTIGVATLTYEVSYTTLGTDVEQVN